MMRLLFLLCLVLAVDAGVSHAQVFTGVERYIATAAGGGDDANDCDESRDIAAPKLTFASAIACMSAGDTLWIRGGTYTQRINVQDAGKTGTANAWIKIAGYPGETVTIRYTEVNVGSYGPIKSRGNRGYFLFQNLIIDCVNCADEVKWQLRDGNHHFTLDQIEMVNFPTSSLYVSADDIAVKRFKAYEQAGASCSPNGCGYGIYWHDGDRGLVEDCEIHTKPGGGIQVHPGPVDTLTIRRCRIHDNNTSPNVPVGGIAINSTLSGTQVLTNINVYDNWIYNNGSDPNSGTAPGIRVESSLTTNVNVFNNVVYGNKGNGISNLLATNGFWGNNVSTANTGTEMVIASGSVTISHSGCTAAESCGTTGKQSIASAAAVFVDPANGDFRLKQGANVLRDNGTSVSTRPSPVSTTDIGATEQGTVTSAVVASTFIEVTVSVMTPGVLPSSAITAFTITNGTSTGTPVVTAAVVKAGSNNIIQLTVSGFTGTGSCTVVYGAGNVTDSLFIGGATNGLAQGVNSGSAAVSGTCDNSAGGTPPAGGLHIHYKLNENAGTSAADEVGANDGTLVNSPTWTTPVIEGSGLYFPNDGTDKKVTIPYGDALNPTSNSFTFCVWVKPDTGLTSKIAFGALSTTNRLYVGYSTTTWGIGVGSSSFSSGQSEFPVTNTNTRLCLINDAGADQAKLAVNGVIGTSAAAVKSTTGFTDLASDFRLGCSILSQAYCGGFTMDEVKIWTTALSAAEILEDFTSYSVAGGSLACYKQQDHRWQKVYLDPNGNPEYYGAAGATVDVVANGAVALVTQFDCTGSVGSAIAVRLYYSTDGVTFTFAVPDVLGAGNVAMWGASTDTQLNRFTATCCLSGALSANHGETVLTSIVSPTITLSQNHSTTLRAIVRVGNIPGQSLWFEWKQDNGAALAGGYITTPRLNVIPRQVGGGPK